MNMFSETQDDNYCRITDQDSAMEGGALQHNGDADSQQLSPAQSAEKEEPQPEDQISDAKKSGDMPDQEFSMAIMEPKDFGEGERNKYGNWKFKKEPSLDACLDKVTIENGKYIDEEQESQPANGD